jgi:predicted kinase
MLTILCGFPGAGKSTATEVEGNIVCSDAVVLCPDDFRKAASGKWFHPPVEEYVWGAVKLTARVLLAQGRHVIIDATHLTVGSRSQWVRIAGEVGVPIRCVWSNTPVEECKRRNALRDDGRRVPDDVMDRMVESFQPPTMDEGFVEVHEEFDN